MVLKPSVHRELLQSDDNLSSEVPQLEGSTWLLDLMRNARKIDHFSSGKIMQNLKRERRQMLARSQSHDDEETQKVLRPGHLGRIVCGSDGRVCIYVLYCIIKL